MQIMCNHDSLKIRFGSLERDYSLSNFNLTGLVHHSLFCQFLLLLYLSSMIHFFHSPFLLCHSKPIPSCHVTMIFNFISHYVRLSTFFYKSNLRMSIGYLQPLVSFWIVCTVVSAIRFWNRLLILWCALYLFVS